jgi:hypothetical protein
MYKPEDNLEEASKDLEENKIESSLDSLIMPSTGAILRPRKYKEIEEESDEEFRIKYHC